MDNCISDDIPKLLKMFPLEEVTAQQSNPFERASNFDAASDIISLTDNQREEFSSLFQSLEKMESGRVSGKECRRFLLLLHFSLTHIHD